MATMRKFGSEGSLLDLDFLPWKRVTLNDPDYEKKQQSGTYTPHMEEDELDVRSADPHTLKPGMIPGIEWKRELTMEHSASVENLSKLGRLDKNHLRVCVISEGCRAYSDGQLAPNAQGSTENVKMDDLPPTFPSSSSKPFLFLSQHSQHHKPKLSAAKLHLKSLFGQVRHQ